MNINKLTFKIGNQWSLLGIKFVTCFKNIAVEILRMKKMQERP